MEIIKVENYEELSLKAADYIVKKVKQTPTLTLGFVSGGTPEGMYRQLVLDHKENGTSYFNVNSINLDEYIGLTSTDKNSYRIYMNNQLFDHIDIQKMNTILPNGAAVDLGEECSRFERIINLFGGIDLQILGIGKNGHIGFNEPGTSFDSPTHLVKLAESTRRTNARYFDRLNDVPTLAITMGIKTILKSKEIVLLASGKEKAEAMDRLLSGPIDENFPASALKNHKKVTIIADKSALSKIMEYSV